ncbi:MAG TPA: ATPase, T2SS/T4P/T4SS family [Patescibacteria group bacterium]|nr:ATPase, T2SS/T4P/T4SS family [Patescibacteria group bacterium]
MSTQSNIILNKIITNVVKIGASYLHLETGSKPIIRIDQKLSSIEDSPVVSQEFLEDITQIVLTKTEAEELSKSKSIVITHTFEGDIRFKIHIFYQRHTLSMIFTYIPNIITDPESLGLSKEFIDLTKRKNGLLIVAGYHGSGRTSTVLSLLSYINKTQSKYILTLERPIEYILTSEHGIIEQREIGRDTESFLSALKFSEESDVDIVSVSEVEDIEVLQSIFNLIESGRLVIIITEAESVSDAIAKLVKLAPEEDSGKIRDTLADVLLGVVLQQLLPRRGGGEVTVMEILISNSASKALIKEGRYAQITSIVQTSRDEGMRSLDQALIELVKTGEVEYDDALSVAINKTDFQVSAQKFHISK